LAEGIRDCVRALPAKQRAAFTLFHLRGMSLTETSVATGCSVSATKVQLHRARARLGPMVANRLRLPATGGPRRGVSGGGRATGAAATRQHVRSVPTHGSLPGAHYTS
jgi:hypothetical protein